MSNRVVPAPMGSVSDPNTKGKGSQQEESRPERGSMRKAAGREARPWRELTGRGTSRAGAASGPAIRNR
jgi:hypothetical protein